MNQNDISDLIRNLVAAEISTSTYLRCFNSILYKTAAQVSGAQLYKIRDEVCDKTWSQVGSHIATTVRRDFYNR